VFTSMGLLLSKLFSKEKVNDPFRVGIRLLKRTLSKGRVEKRGRWLR
jgi:hypothetical protein